MEKVLIISFSNLTTDPRLNRQFKSLSNSFKLFVAGYNCPTFENVHFINLIHHKKSFLEKIFKAIKLIFRRFNSVYWDKKMKQDYSLIKNTLDSEKVDIIYANDIESLPLAFKLKECFKCKVVFDAHEYAPREWEDKLIWRLVIQPYILHYCNQFIPKVDLCITVGQRIAEEYQSQFGLKKVHVILNAPSLETNLSPSKVDPNNIRMIHHGGAIKSRKLELMIDMMDYLDDRYSLDLMLVPSDINYLNQLKKKAKSKKVTFIPPVPMKDIAKEINQYDLGVYILDQSKNFNNKNALPNKFFEFIQGRLAIAIAPSPEMKLAVNSYNLGVVSNEFSPSSLAKELNRLTADDIRQFKENTIKAAKVLNSKNESKKLLDLVKSVIEVNACAELPL